MIAAVVQGREQGLRYQLPFPKPVPNQKAVPFVFLVRKAQDWEREGRGKLSDHVFGLVVRALFLLTGTIPRHGRASTFTDCGKVIDSCVSKDKEETRR